MNMEEKPKKLHVAMFPWLALGHILPHLELAKVMAQKGHEISFISTPRNIDRLPKLPQNLSQLITFVRLPLPSVQGLPSGAEATSDLPAEEAPTLKRAFNLLKGPLSRFLESSKPDWVVYDFAAVLVPEMSSGLEIPRAMLSLFNASSMAFMGNEVPDYRSTHEDFTVSPRWVPYHSNVAYRRFEAKRLQLAEVVQFATVFEECDIIVVRSCWEFEEKPLSLLAHLHGKPVLPVGHIPPTLKKDDDEEETDTWRSMKNWLDDHEEKSVVYVAFGSESQFSEDELKEIALGLELSNLPFLWVLRSTRFSPSQLPNGFEERIQARGYICRSWVPQVKILGHDSIGAFLSHCGWSSVIEALTFSRPLVGLALACEQGLNLKLLEEKMIGYTVPRDENDGSFTRDGIAESLTTMVTKEEGKVYRDKMKEVSAIVSDKQVHDRYVDEFLGYLKTHTKKCISDAASDSRPK